MTTDAALLDWLERNMKPARYGKSVTRELEIHVGRDTKGLYYVSVFDPEERGGYDFDRPRPANMPTFREAIAAAMALYGDSIETARLLPKPPEGDEIARTRPCATPTQRRS